MKKGFSFFLAMTLSIMLSANDVVVTNLIRTGKNTTSHFMLVQFDISWQNSWRTSFAPNNWDAAWVFVKYRIPASRGGDGLWKHAWLNNSGHTAPAVTTIDIGLLSPAIAFDPSVNPGLGAFIYSDADAGGPFVRTGFQLRWNYGANGVADDAAVEIQVFAIEMVYVTQGAFTVGTGGTESGSFTNGSWISGAAIPLSISSENALTIGQTAGNLWGTSSSGYNTIGGPGALDAAFPKGYNAFYCMKYEISQQGYVDFLNNLTTTQATNRYPNQTTRRHGITVTSGVYSSSLPYVACNWLSWADLAAYLDWSGLRPMTELEFEKSCRGPLTPVANEYAWGTVGIAGTAPYTLNNSGLTNETIASNYSPLGNAAYNATISTSGINGPVRVGIFAATGGNTGRETAGATYYGMMEMSGNVWERAITVANADGRNYTGAHGDGELDATGNADPDGWPRADATGAGFRGGFWFSAASTLQVSDRVVVAITLNGRAYDFGGRGVRGVLTD
jgi:formylglycine-generating enzyme required for sulfatase activity